MHEAGRPPQVPALEPGPSTRDRLLDSAARVIARDGYHRARLIDVARAAGLTTGAIYSNFRDKEELFLAAFDRIQGLNASLFEEAPHGLEDLIAGYREAAERFEDSKDLQVLNFELALLGARDPRIRGYLEQGLRETVASVAELLAVDEAGAGEGEPHAAAEAIERRAWERTAAVIVGLGNGLALARMFAPDLIPLDLVETLLRRVASDPEMTSQARR
jgi:AcrR family transcriptional regulator